jgi:hypothetical protein
MTSIQQRIEDDKITMDCGYAITPSWADDNDGMTWYEVMLHRAGRKLIVPACTGGGEPDAADVLGCLVSAATSANQKYKDWCGDYGFDPGDRRHRLTYEHVRIQTAALRRFLSRDYRAYVYDTEY